MVTALLQVIVMALAGRLLESVPVYEEVESTVAKHFDLVVTRVYGEESDDQKEGRV